MTQLSAKGRTSDGLTLALADAVIALGLLVLLGWAADWPLLTRISPDWVAMQPLTALAFLFAGLALHFVTVRQWRAATVVWVPLIAIPAYALGQHLTGRSPGIETLLFPTAVRAPDNALCLGRMAEITAIEFLLFGFFLAWPRRTPRRYRHASRMATLGLLIALVGLAGYFLGAHQLARVGSYAPMPAPAAFGFVLLFTGGVWSQRDRNWLRFLLASSTGAQLARRLLLHIAGWPVVLGIAIPIVHPLVESLHLELAIYVVALSGVLIMAVVHFARRFHQAEARSSRIQAALNASKEKYQSLFSNMSEGFALGEVIYDRQGKPVNYRVLEANGAFYQETGLAPEILGRPAREHLPELEQYWLNAYDMVVGTGKSVRLQNYNADTNRHYDLCAFRPSPGHFAIVFRDITDIKRVEKALQESDRHLRQLIATLPGGVWTSNPEGWVEFISQRWLDYTGLSLESQLGPRAFAPLHPEDQGRVEKLWEEAIASQRPFHVEYRLRRHDGAYRWFKSQGTPLLDTAGHVAGWLGIITDIDDLKQTQEALMASRTELMEAHRLAKFGTWFWDARTGETHASDSLREVFGRDVPPFAEQRGRLLAVESWEQISLAAQETARTGIGNDLELQAIHGNGSTIWVHSKCETVRSPSGEVIGLRGTIQDITERKKTLEALHQSKARFQAVFEQAAVGISWNALDGTWLQVNDKLCAIVGYQREDLLRFKFQDITHPADLAADLELAQKLLAGQTSNCSLEKRYVRQDGTPVWINLTVSLVRDSLGAPDYYIAVIEDIQPRKDAEAALEAARQTHLQHLEQQVAERTAALSEARDHLEQRVTERTAQVRRLAAEVTYAEERERQALARDLHDDLGQLLHVARIKVGLLGREELSARKSALVEEISAIMADASRQVRSLTSQLSPPILATLGLPAALHWLSEEFQATYGLAVTCRAEALPDGLSAAQAAILFRVARELLINVAKHSGSPSATLDLGRGERGLALTVEDRGDGIQGMEEALAGTKGFGLASVRERIAFLGGTMAIETPSGGGVRIVLHMPLAAATDPTEETP